MKTIVAFFSVLFLTGSVFGQENNVGNIDFSVPGFTTSFPNVDDSLSMSITGKLIRKKSNFKELEIIFSCSGDNDLYKESCLLLRDRVNNKYYLGQLFTDKKTDVAMEPFQTKVDELWTYVMISWAKTRQGKINTPDYFTLIGYGAYSYNFQTTSFYIYSLDNILVNNTPLIDLVIKGLGLKVVSF